MQVADFFCGAGGFSEGFRQAGFRIVFAVDNWMPAIDTFRMNKPGCDVRCENVLTIANLPDDEFNKFVPDTEIIIGSPPCVAFSNSNKSGNGDKQLGIKLLEAYLRIVARKKNKENSILKYWVLENVPNIQSYIKDEYTASDLGLPGDSVLKVKNSSAGIYNAKYFGAPTNRKRFLGGSFPKLTETNTDESVVTLGDVLASLGEPMENMEGEIRDCNYPDLTMLSSHITDHHYLPMLQPFEWGTAKRLKVDKGYMGRMAFPERMDRPARTIMATMSTSSRESMILASGYDKYRLPTVREIASIMSFPIDYQFCGTTKSIKYALVGNAVPPKLSNAIARAILKAENIPVDSNYIRITRSHECAFVNLNNTKYKKKEERPKRTSARFKRHIPYLVVNGFRVELSNEQLGSMEEEHNWHVSLHRGQGKKYAKVYPSTLADAKLLSEDVLEKCAIFLAEIKPRLLVGWDLQKAYCLTSYERRLAGKVGPEELLELIKLFLDSQIDEEEFERMVNLSGGPQEVPMQVYIGFVLLHSCINFGGDLCGSSDSKARIE